MQNQCPKLPHDYVAFSKSVLRVFKRWIENALGLIKATKFVVKKLAFP